MIDIAGWYSKQLSFVLIASRNSSARVQIRIIAVHVRATFVSFVPHGFGILVVLGRRCWFGRQIGDVRGVALRWCPRPDHAGDPCFPESVELPSNMLLASLSSLLTFTPP